MSSRLYLALNYSVFSKIKKYKLNDRQIDFLFTICDRISFFLSAESSVGLFLNQSLYYFFVVFIPIILFCTCLILLSLILKGRRFNHGNLY